MCRIFSVCGMPILTWGSIGSILSLQLDALQCIARSGHQPQPAFRRQQQQSWFVFLIKSAYLSCFCLSLSSPFIIICNLLSLSLSASLSLSLCVSFSVPLVCRLFSFSRRPGLAGRVDGRCAEFTNYAPIDLITSKIPSDNQFWRRQHVRTLRVQLHGGLGGLAPLPLQHCGATTHDLSPLSFFCKFYLFSFSVYVSCSQSSPFLAPTVVIVLVFQLNTTDSENCLTCAPNGCDAACEAELQRPALGKCGWHLALIEH